MKPNHRLALAVLVGVAIGVAGGMAIHAQQVKTPPVYLISEADAITDLTAIKTYGERSGPRLRLSIAITTLSLLAVKPRASMAKPRHRALS